MSTLLLSASDVRCLCNMAEVLEAVEKVFAAAGADSGNLAPHHLPAVMDLYVLSDPLAAVPLAVLDATWLTAIRAGAAGAVASKFLAVTSPRSIGFVGCGVHARVLLEAHRVLFDSLEIRATDSNVSAAEAFADEVGGLVTSLERACSADIVCTTTPSRDPIIESRWIGAGTHINAIGVDGSGKQELDPQLLKCAKLVIDDLEQASRDIHATLGEVVAGVKAGRTGDEISIFDSTGLTVQDAAVAKLIFERARQRNVGSHFDFRA